MKNFLLLAFATVFSAMSFAQSNENYNMVVYQKNGSVLKYPVANIDSVTFEQEAPLNEPFKMELVTLEKDKVELKVTPQDKNMKYYFEFMTEEMEQLALEKYADLYESDIAWMEEIGSYYGLTWYEAMWQLSAQGDSIFTPHSDLGYVPWDTKITAHCYGIDENGNKLTEMHKLSFKTLAPVPSSNQLNMEITETTKDGCKIKVTTTNDDPYFFTAQPKEYVDKFNGNDDEMAKDLFPTLMAYNSMNIEKGSKELQLRGSSSNSDYVLIYCGFDGGPTTKINKINFRTK